jgi:hypothetical protein
MMMQNNSEKLVLISQKIDALVAELGQIENDPVRCADIMEEIVQLGRLYLRFRNGVDLVLH